VTDLTEAQQDKLDAAAFRRLISHLDNRKDVQNIDLMILADFCRNCLGDWYREAAEAEGLEMSKDAARARVYGIRYVVAFTALAATLPLIAIVYDRWGFDTLFAVLAVTAFLILCAVALLPRQLPSAEHSTVTAT